MLRHVKKLRESRSQIYVNEDLPPEVKKQRADMRVIANYARSQQEAAIVKGDTLVLNQTKYKYDVLDLLPPRYSLSAAMPPKISNNVVGFHSAHSPLSNFCSCKITIDGETYSSTEQYYQWQKYKITGNEVIGQRIMLEKDPLRIKRLGDRVVLKPNSEWPAKEEDVMRTGNMAKYLQNYVSMATLLGTDDAVLVEATRDGHWGGSCSLWSENLKKTDL